MVAIHLANSIMLDKAKDLSVEIVRLCREIKTVHHETVLTNQLLRSATSIGANLHEVKYSQGTADFIFKKQIALKNATNQIIGRNCSTAPIISLMKSTSPYKTHAEQSAEC